MARRKAERGELGHVYPRAVTTRNDEHFSSEIRSTAPLSFHVKFENLR